MINIENKNPKECQNIKRIQIGLLIVLFILSMFAIAALINPDFLFHSLRFFLLAFMFLIAFYNYLKNLSTTMNYALSIYEETFYYESGKRVYGFQISEIKKLFFLKQSDVTGVSNYVIIIRKKFKRNLFISDQKHIDCDLTELMTHPKMIKIKTIKSNNSFLSQLILSFYLSISI